MIRGVYETVLYGDDLGAITSFYRDVLGLRPVSEMGDLGVAFRLPDGGMLLLFDAAKTAVPGRPVPSHGASGPGHAAFSVDDLEAWSERLAAHGVAVEGTTTWRLGGRSVYFRDPAGNSLELVAGEAWPD